MPTTHTETLNPSSLQANKNNKQLIIYDLFHWCCRRRANENAYLQDQCGETWNKLLSRIGNLFLCYAYYSCSVDVRAQIH